MYSSNFRSKLYILKIISIFKTDEYNDDIDLISKSCNSDNCRING